MKHVYFISEESSIDHVSQEEVYSSVSQSSSSHLYKYPMKCRPKKKMCFIRENTDLSLICS